MPLVPDVAQSSPVKDSATAKDGPEPTSIANDDASVPNPRVPPSQTDVPLEETQQRKDREQAKEEEDDDRKPAAKETTTEKRGAKRAHSADNPSEPSSERNPYRRRRFKFTPLPIGSVEPESSTPPPLPPANFLLEGKSSDVWNANLQHLWRGTNSHQSLPPVTVLELLQQAQERLVFPPTRFPPRESPLHQIFQSVVTAKGDRDIFGPLEECYREMLEQDACLEELLRKEYRPLLRLTPSARERLRRRAGQIFALEKSLHQEEQVLLDKLKDGLDKIMDS